VTRALLALGLASLLVAAPAHAHDESEPPSDVGATPVEAEPQAEAEVEPRAEPEPDEPPEDDEIVPGGVAFTGPHFRLGFHVSAGAILHRPHWGGFGGFDLVIGARVAKEWSVIARLDVALGGWQRQSARFLNGAGGAIGVEHIAFRAFGPGSALALTVTGGVWLPDECRAGACLFLAPMLDVSAAYLTHMNREPANPLAAWSIGLSGGLGVDVANEELAGRFVLFVGHDVSL
jgi:hypothetical protein